eukprot:2124981-Amphidinium_carterae.1
MEVSVKATAFVNFVVNIVAWMVVFCTPRLGSECSTLHKGSRMLTRGQQGCQLASLELRMAPLSRYR